MYEWVPDFRGLPHRQPFCSQFPLLWAHQLQCDVLSAALVITETELGDNHGIFCNTEIYLWIHLWCLSVLRCPGCWDYSWLVWLKRKGIFFQIFSWIHCRSTLCFLILQICAAPLKESHLPLPVFGWSNWGHPYSWHVHFWSKVLGVTVQSQCFGGCHMVWWVTKKDT